MFNVDDKFFDKEYNATFEILKKGRNHCYFSIYTPDGKGKRNYWTLNEDIEAMIRHKSIEKLDSSKEGE